MSKRTDIQAPLLRRSCTRPSTPRLMLYLPLQGVMEVMVMERRQQPWRLSPAARLVVDSKAAVAAGGGVVLAEQSAVKQNGEAVGSLLQPPLPLSPHACAGLTPCLCSTGCNAPDVLKGALVLEFASILKLHVLLKS